MNREDRWQHLVNVAFLLSERVAARGGGGGGAPPDVRAAVSLLEEILEVFPDSIDPVEDFEGYAVRRLALALRDVLS